MIKNKTGFTSASFPPVTVNLSIKREQVYPFRDLNTDFSVKSVQKLKNRYLQCTFNKNTLTAAFRSCLLGD